MSLLGWTLLILAGAAVAFIVGLFVSYKLEADREDREAQDECEHRGAPYHDEAGILRCGDCDKDLED